MKHLKLSYEPVFPIEIKRRKSDREKWVRAGLVIFKAIWPGGKAVCKMTECATESGNRKTLLRINAVIVLPTAEVWDNNSGLCRIWFKVGTDEYESARINGWNPVKKHAMYSGKRCSEEALEKACEIASKIPTWNPPKQ